MVVVVVVGGLGRGLEGREAVVCKEEGIIKCVGKISRGAPQLWEELGLGFRVISGCSLCFFVF